MEQYNNIIDVKKNKQQSLCQKASLQYIVQYKASKST